jgi:hypothetical protein
VPRIRAASVREAHDRIGDVACAWRDTSIPEDARRYAYRCGTAHLLAAGRPRDAAALATDFEHQLARRRAEGSYAEGDDIDPWTRDLAAVAQRIPRRDTRAWADFARTSKHLFRTEGWEGWRVLFQAAMDHADDSPVTLGAEAYEASGKRDWSWLRWVNRPKVWQQSACLAVMVGHEGGVASALELDGGRVLSWSRDKALRIWDIEAGATMVVLKGHMGSVNGALALDGGRLLSWSGGFTNTDYTLRLWDAATGAPLGVLEGAHRPSGWRARPRRRSPALVVWRVWSC